MGMGNYQQFAEQPALPPKKSEAKPVIGKEALPKTEAQYGMKGFEQRQKIRQAKNEHIDANKECIFDTLNESDKKQLRGLWGKSRKIWSDGTKTKKFVIEYAAKNADTAIIIEATEKYTEPEKLLSTKKITGETVYLSINRGYGRSLKIRLTKAEQQYAKKLKLESEKWAQEALVEAKPVIGKALWQMTKEEYDRNLNEQVEKALLILDNLREEYKQISQGQRIYAREEISGSAWEKVIAVGNTTVTRKSLSSEQISRLYEIDQEIQDSTPADMSYDLQRGELKFTRRYATRKEQIKERVEQGKPVPREVLEEYNPKK